MKYIDADRLIAYLEREANIEFKKTEENANSPVLCHFHNGCRMQALDTIDFIKQLQQEQPEVDLEKAVSEQICIAADKHIKRVVDAAGHPGWDWTTQDIADAFKAGAEWQKSQMLKDAVEGEIVKDITNKLAVTAKGINLDGFKFGQKVRIVVLKAEEE